MVHLLVYMVRDAIIMPNFYKEFELMNIFDFFDRWTLVVLAVVLVLVWKFSASSSQVKEPFLRGYYRACPHVATTKVEERALKELGLIPTTSDHADWTVYLPCGYNSAEFELQEKEKLFEQKRRKSVVVAIQGMDFLAAKNALWSLLKKKYGRLRAQIFMPETWSLTDVTDLEHLQRMVAGGSPADDRTYILKKNIQRQEGLFLTKYIDIQKAIRDGYVVVQRMLRQPYLIQGRKTNLRMYVLVVCTGQNKKVYLYNNGFVYYTPHRYVEDSIDSKKTITSGYIDRSVYQYSPLTLQDFLGYVERHNGAGTARFLWGNLVYLIKGVMDAVENSICRQRENSNIINMQLFGADVQVNSALDDPKILEFNKGSDQSTKDHRDAEVKTKLHTDMYEVVQDCDNVGGLSITNGFSLIADYGR